MKNGMYNPLKLSEYRPLFHGIKVLIIGGGAVGSHVAENIAKMGSSPDIIDFDTFTLENAAKHSSLVRTPEDVGRNKAVCVSERLQPFLEEGCSSNGMDADLCMLGPEAIAEYDVVILCVDNYAAKVLFNQLWMQIPKDRRPKVIMDGTYNELAQSTALDGSQFCLRCLMDESWLVHSEIRTSCSGPQLRMIEGVQEIVRTSGLASSIAANLSAEQYRGIVIGAPDVLNHRVTYTAYPNLELSIGNPRRKTSCPDCSIEPPEEIRWLDGCVLDTTLEELQQKVQNDLGDADFEIAVHKLFYKNVAYYGFIVDDVCHVCGNPMPVMKHEGRTFLEDLKCYECRKTENPARFDTSFARGHIVYAFHKDSEKAIKDMTLYDLGYPLGAHIEVIQRNGAFDFLDSDKIRTYTYAMKGDPSKMHTISKLA